MSLPDSVRPAGGEHRTHRHPGKHGHGASRRFTYHPREMTFCGYSGSGKTTLVCKLLRRWADHYQVGYVKHDAHRFAIDKEGKDTYSASEAGAASVLINDPRHFARISRMPYSIFEKAYSFVDADFVIAEGFKQSTLPKMLLLDEEGRALDGFRQGTFSHVCGVIGVEHRDERPLELGDTPYFHRDDVDAIAAFIESRFFEQADAPLYGLVLMGGQSRRMGRPKWSLSYGAQTQAQRVSDLLAGVCDQVFLSTRADQQEENLPPVPRILDSFPSWGPTTGMLSAMQEHPEAAWLVVACDLPFLDGATLRDLVSAADPLKIATAYRSATDGLPEPLCAIYQPRAAQRLLQAAGMGLTCPRKVLLESAPRLLDLRHPRALDNVNTPEEFQAALASMEESS